MKCSVCGGKLFCKGLCKRCYRRQYYRQPEVKKHYKDYQREYSQRLEVKERKRTYAKEYAQRPEVKEHRRKYAKEYFQRPEIKERRKEYMKNYREEYRQKQLGVTIDDLISLLRKNNGVIRKSDFFALGKTGESLSLAEKCGVVKTDEEFIHLVDTPLLSAFNGYYEEKSGEKL